jgi:hypothetical protein
LRWTLLELGALPRRWPTLIHKASQFFSPPDPLI